MKRIAILVVCIIFLSGCATGIMVTRDIKPEISAKPDSSTLVIIRDAFFGMAVTFWHYLDGKLIGETNGKTYFVTPVKPGQHYVVVATENTAVANIDFQPGKTYFLREGVIMGLWRTRASGFEPLTYEQAMESIQNCTYRELDTSKTAEDMNPQLYKKAIEEYHTEVKQNPDGFKNILEYRGYQFHELTPIFRTREAAGIMELNLFRIHSGEVWNDGAHIIVQEEFPQCAYGVGKFYGVNRSSVEIQ